MSAPIAPVEPPSDLLPSYVNELVPKVHSVRKDCKSKQLVDYIVSDIKKIPNIAQKKNDIVIIQRICTLIENCVEKKDKINKLDLAVQICNLVFGQLTPDEINVLKNGINFLCDSKGIMKISYISRAYNYVSKVISSNFLF